MYTMDNFSGIKKELNLVICIDMDGAMELKNTDLDEHQRLYGSIESPYFIPETSIQYVYYNGIKIL